MVVTVAMSVMVVAPGISRLETLTCTHSVKFFPPGVVSVEECALAVKSASRMSKMVVFLL